MGLTDPFWNTFAVMIQLGAILGVVVLYFQRLWRVLVTLPSDAASRHFAISILIAFLPALVLAGLLLTHVLLDPVVGAVTFTVSVVFLATKGLHLSIEFLGGTVDGVGGLVASQLAAKGIETSNEWIVSRTGMKERRVSHVFIADVPTYPRTLLITDAAPGEPHRVVARRLEVADDLLQQDERVRLLLGLGGGRLLAPAIIVCHEGDQGVTHFRLAGEFRLRHGRHPDQIAAPQPVHQTLGPGGKRGAFHRDGFRRKNESKKQWHVR